MTTIYPTFVFDRKHEIEIESGLVLAGDLYIDVPPGKMNKARIKKAVAKLVSELVRRARCGAMSLDTVVYGWPEGPVELRVDDTDHAAMEAWAARGTAIMLRVDDKPDSGFIKIDHEVMRRWGEEQ
jgi:fructose-1,6-bisphosphatase/inositol monophosphatase family enzyme